MTLGDPQPYRVATPDESYRLYVDESGDHVFKHLDDPGHRYLCLLGCVFKNRDYWLFHRALEDFKERHIPHSPDEPVILHREDIVNRRGPFWRLRVAAAAQAFDSQLLDLVAQAEFLVIAVLIDKKALRDAYATPAHPYHLAMGFLLQRYCGLLNHINRHGDVLAESRGGTEDRMLKDSYTRTYDRGAWMTRAEFFQRALTSHQLKLKPQSSNIAGLQLADILGNPVRQAMLAETGRSAQAPAPFAAHLLDKVNGKFNRHLYDGRVWGYGKVLFPK
jgi:hypothetical protein